MNKPKKNINIAVIGQPNSGKTSLFNKLTGSNQQVGNWSGVTVEKKEGKFLLEKQKINIIDLPGIYSLSAVSIEEKVTRDYLLNENPDLIINIINAANLERQLFLTIQLLFTGIPIILVLNMIDEVEDKGFKIDTKRLSELLGIKVVETVARDAKGIDNLKKEIKSNLNNPVKYDLLNIFNKNEIVIQKIEQMTLFIEDINLFSEHKYWFILKFLENDSEVLNKIKAFSIDLFNSLSGIKEDLVKSLNSDISSLVPDWIFGITHGINAEVHKESIKKQSAKMVVSNFLDLIFLNKISGIPFFFIIIFLLFQSTFFLGNFLIEYLSTLINYLSGFVDVINNQLIVSLIKNGIIGGVGNILLLTPYIFIMFLLMSLLEDSGYMARAAFVMDRFMHKLGLHGKSFIPLMMGFGCNVPAIMSARTLDSHEERIKTIMMIPFISCSARLPVFVLLSAAFFGKYGGFVVFILYVIGIMISVITGILLNKTVLTKKSEGLIMELPPYRMPHFINSVTSTLPKLKHYFVKAGTVILFSSIILWFLSYFPDGKDFGGEHSFIGSLGKIIGVILAPLGFDWKMTVGLISGFVAKEIIISTLSVLYSTGGNLVSILPGIINPIIGFSYLSFILIYTPCLAAVAVIKSETNSLKWTIFSILYSVGFAWVVSFIITNVGKLIFKF